jgi:hypothetical protein
MRHPDGIMCAGTELNLFERGMRDKFGEKRNGMATERKLLY